MMFLSWVEGFFLQFIFYCYGIDLLYKNDDSVIVRLYYIEWKCWD